MSNVGLRTFAGFGAVSRGSSGTTTQVLRWFSKFAWTSSK
jgi:hypothetical protein